MKYIKLFESKDDYTLSVKKSFIRAYAGSNATSTIYEKIETYNVKLNLNNKLVSKCFFIKPYIENDKVCLRDGGSSETFSGDDKFVKLYDVKSIIKGKGYGEILFDKLKEYLKSQGVDKIYLDVDIENNGAQKFYKRIGFKEKWKGYDDYRYILKF